MRFAKILLLILCMTSCDAIKARETNKAKTGPYIYEKLFNSYEQYKEKIITHRRFKHKDIVPILQKMQQMPLFEVKVIGQSLQNRDIYLVKAGTGKTKVLLWSQMHGDEPTATMAMMDIFNFLNQEPGKNPIRDSILANTTLYFIPMLNPDGAEIYERRNAVGVDLNRDAASLQSPEAKILKSVRDSLKPDFGFNLHDQNTRYTAGKTGKSATISFLAPPYDYAKSVNEVRGNAMKLIVLLNKSLQQYIPNHVAKYSDEHEPRAFGDNIQKWGTSVILIEAGGYKDDPEKQYIRKLKYMTLLTAFHAIASTSYKSENIDDYYKIPENERYLYDLVIRNAKVQRNGGWFTMDVGVNLLEINAKQSTTFYYRSTVEEIGDMSVVYGYNELDAKGLQLVPGKIYPVTQKNITAVKQMDIPKLLQQGYTAVRVEKYETPEKYTNLPINIVTGQKDQNNDVNLFRHANFTLQENGKVQYAIINGFVYDLKENKSQVKNALVY